PVAPPACYHGLIKPCRTRRLGVNRMSHHNPRLEDLFLTRREMLRRSGMGFGALGLAGLLEPANTPGANASGSPSVNPLTPKAPHFAGKAKRFIHIFANGGASHVDTFDPKPKLDEYHGKPLPTANLRTERKTGAAFRSPFKFAKHGQSGI